MLNLGLFLKILSESPHPLYNYPYGEIKIFKKTSRFNAVGVRSTTAWMQEVEQRRSSCRDSTALFKGNVGLFTAICISFEVECCRCTYDR